MSRRYTRDRLLIRLGDVEVHRARDLESDGEALLAFVPDRDKDTHMRFQGRVRALERVEHPALAPILASGELGGGILFLAQGGAGGVPLEAVLAAGLGSPEERARWREELAGAVAALRDAGVAHGRIEARTCLVLPGGEVLLAFPDTDGRDSSPDGDARAWEELAAALAPSPEAAPLDAEGFERLRSDFLAGPPPAEKAQGPKRLPRAPHRPPEGLYHLPLVFRMAIGGVALLVAGALYWIWKGGAHG